MSKAKMKHQSSKHVKPHTDPFGPFQKATRKAFAFLAEAPYKFEAGEPIVHIPECTINYLNKTTGVTVCYEWGGSPSVVLKRLEQPSSSISTREQMGLKLLVMERCPSAIGEFDREMSSGDLEKSLSEYARILKECGDDILRVIFKFSPNWSDSPMRSCAGETWKCLDLKPVSSSRSKVDFAFTSQSWNLDEGRLPANIEKNE